MKYLISIVCKELFQVSLITYLILLVTELIKKESISYFFNLNYLMIIVVLSGILMLITNYNIDYKAEAQSSKLTSWNWQFIFLMSVGGGSLVYYKTADLGGLSLIISLLAMIIIFLLSYLIYTDTE
jgi:hypothetical protein